MIFLSELLFVGVYRAIVLVAFVEGKGQSAPKNEKLDKSWKIIRKVGEVLEQKHIARSTLTFQGGGTRKRVVPFFSCSVFPSLEQKRWPICHDHFSEQPNFDNEMEGTGEVLLSAFWL